MQIDCKGFTAITDSPLWEDGTIFTCCTFRDLTIDGASIDGGLIQCGFQRVDWYWGLFNTAIIAHTKFEDCVFRGCSFRGVEFVDCVFERCRFTRDNLDGTCVFDDCRIVECSFERSEFIAREAPGREPLFTRSRFYGCTQKGSKGLEGLF
jgi:fluoroquinolone resistance protein